MDRTMSIIDTTGHRNEILGEAKTTTHKATATANSSRNEKIEVVSNREMTDVRTNGNVESKASITGSLTIRIRMDQIRTGITTNMSQTRQMSGL